MSFKPENLGGASTGVERSEQEKRDLKREAAYIVRLFAPHEMTVVPSHDGSWKCSMSQGPQAMEVEGGYKHYFSSLILYLHTH